jgi:hypothetical protein
MTTAALGSVNITDIISVPLGNPGDAQETAIIFNNRERITAIFRLLKAHNFSSLFRFFQVSCSIKVATCESITNAIHV